MTDITGGITGSTSASGVQLTPKGKNEQIGQQEFLNLLVTQLKNQDPEAPMDSKEFAVQLAQFTQVERLISIDQKLSTQSEAATMGSLAGYLGHKVVLDSQSVDVKGGQGGDLQIDLARESSAAKVQLLDSSGKVVGEKELGQLKSGKQVVSLNDLGVPDGSYSLKVVALSRFGGGTVDATAQVIGLVSGFIPGPDPRLIVNGRTVSMGAIREVALGA
jgi:flagellar basal-body rod modification protein FlgD